MPDGTSVSVEVENSEPNSLENGILIHGFRGNVSKPESETVIQVITAGSIVSPCLRSEDSKTTYEQRLGVFDTRGDTRRIYFSILNDKPYSAAYNGEIFFAAPSTVLTGTNVADDYENELFCLNPDGVSINLEQGLLVLTSSCIEWNRLWDTIEQHCNRLGVQPAEWIRQNILLVEPDTLNDRTKLFNALKKRIQPAKNVTAKFVKGGNSRFDRFGNGDFEIMEQSTPISRESLGNSEKIPGDVVSAELYRNLSDLLSYYKTFISNIDESNPENIGKLYGQIGESFSLSFTRVDHMLQLLCSETELAKLSSELKIALMSKIELCKRAVLQTLY